MANYYAKFLSNYFSVTDEVKFKELMELCRGEDEIEVFSEKQQDGTMKFGFGCLGVIYGISENNDISENDDVSENDDDSAEEIDLLYASLQKLIPPDKAVIITEIGNEKLNYFVAQCVVITANEIRTVDARRTAVELAGTLLGNPGFETKLDY